MKPATRWAESFADLTTLTEDTAQLHANFCEKLRGLATNLASQKEDIKSGRKRVGQCEDCTCFLFVVGF